jgi:SAM-dependent methyltransferase
MSHAAPYALSAALEQTLALQCMQGAFSKSSLARLAACVQTIADIYTGGREPCAAFEDPMLRRAYAAYYVPCNAVKLFPVLREIESHWPLLSRGGCLRVLDLGCGPGSLLAGLLDFCMQYCGNTAPELDITAIDRDGANCAGARRLISAYCDAAPDAPAVTSLRLLTGNVHRLDMLPASSGFDLIMAGNLINELGADGHADLARRITALLNPDGILVILDPGTRQAFKNLLLFRHELLRHQMRLVAPCLQAGSCPLQHSPEAWCHEKLFWSPPQLVRLIDERTGFTKHKGLKFCYLVAANGAHNRCVPAAAEDIWRIVSYVIRSKGEERLYVCNGCERRLLRRLTRITTAASADFSKSERGDTVRISGAEPRNGFFNIGPEAVFHKTC